jgi:hypothetical protein
MTLPAYNGWPNYPTWCAALWLGESGDDLDELARCALESADRDVYVAVDALADALRDRLTEDAPDLKSSLYSDLLTWAIGYIDTRDIAEQYIGDAMIEMYIED